MSATCTLFVFLALIVATCGFQWTSGPSNTTAVSLCIHQNLNLPWDYTTDGDQVTSIIWHFHGRSEELIAIKTLDDFSPMAAYSHRVQHVPKAGIQLSHVTSGDAGNYTVVISGHESSGTSFTSSRSVIVDVSDHGPLPTTDGQLHAVLKSGAVYDSVTSQWSLVLACGTFNPPDNPPVIVEWITPSGSVVNSTAYVNGEYQLQVASGGDYMCRVRPTPQANFCDFQVETALHVDPVEARLTLLENKQAQLLTETHRLQNENQQLKDENSLLQQTLQSQNNSLQQQIHTLQAAENSLAQSIQHLANSSSSSPPVAFHAFLDMDDWNSEAPATGSLVFQDVLVNAGNGYDNSTGMFTAPRAGYYFLAFSARPASSWPDAGVFLGNQTLCSIDSDVTGDNASCQTIVHLAVGDKVHVEASGTLCCIYTAFTGFLIAQD